MAISTPFVCILLCLWLARSIVTERHGLPVFGERFSVERLGQGEEIVVRKVAGDAGPPLVRGYHVFRVGNVIRIVAFLPADSPDLEDSNFVGDKVTAIHDLSTSEIRGLDTTVAEFRKRGDEHGIGNPRFRFQYLRNSKLVGEETFSVYSFASELAYLRRKYSSDTPELQEGYERISRSYEIEYEKVKFMVPFETFEPEPNQSLEPMARSVTPRADARVAPALAMAHH